MDGSVRIATLGISHSTAKVASLSRRTEPWPNTGVWFFVYLVATLGLLVFWRLVPQLDIAISDAFFKSLPCQGEDVEGAICGTFPLERARLALALREVGLLLPRFVIVGLIVWAIVLTIRNTAFADRSWQCVITGLGSLLLGPILIVNLWLKAHSGRARPFRTEPFGGDAPFTLPGDFVSYCASNCSFTSGEASGAFWLLFIVPFISRAWRKPVAILLFVLAVIIALLRVMVGRHFFSDASLSALITLTCIAFMGWVMPVIVEFLENARSNRRARNEAA